MTTQEGADCDFEPVDNTQKCPQKYQAAFAYEDSVQVLSHQTFNYMENSKWAYQKTAKT